MRGLLIALSAALVALLPATSVLAADVNRFTASGNWAVAVFGNIDWEQELQPGDYFSTEVWAANAIYTENGDAFDEGSVCVWHYAFTIDEGGDYQDEEGFGHCADGADLSIARRLTDGHLVASVPIVECVWDEVSEDCVDYIDLGTVEVDLHFMGEGPTYRWHGTGTGGTAGFYQYTNHGTGTGRAASVTGAVDLVSPGGALTDLTGGLDGDGEISHSSQGYTEVVITSDGAG